MAYDDSVTISAELRREGANSAFWLTITQDWERIFQRGHTLLVVEESDVAIALLRDTDRPDQKVYLAAHGDPQLIVDILTAQVGDLPRPASVIVPREILALLTPELDQWLPDERGNEWDFFWTDRPLHTAVREPDQATGEPEAIRSSADTSSVPAEKTWLVEVLSADEARELIPAFLAQANPHTGALDNLDAHTWWVIREGSVLAAVGAEDRGTIRDLRIVHLAGLGTLPTERGRGLGSALMAGVAEQLLGSYDLVTFGMWAKNDRARRVYDALGYINGARNLMMSDQPFSEEPDLAEG